MKLPRDVSGEELALRLARFGYRLVRQTGSHMRLVSSYRGAEHRLTIPRHGVIRVGTLHQILREIAEYLDLDRDALLRALFGEK